VDIVIFHLVKAFDKVPHNKLYEKSRKHLINEKLLHVHVGLIVN